MKLFTSTFLVNRLLPSLFSLTLLFSIENAYASETGNPVLHSNTPVVNNDIIGGIDYTSLVANATEKAVFINWVTASELNNSHFEVERSFDMNIFETVALVLDGFSAGTGKTYKFKEDAGAVRKGKTVYYRLKQIGTDNQVHYSKVLAVQLNKTIIAYPATNDVSGAAYKFCYPNNLTNTGLNKVPAARFLKTAAGIC